MKLEKITIKNFRSIKECEIDLQDQAIVLGKNNEGKSNILRAIHIFKKIIDFYSSSVRFTGDLKTKHRMSPNFRREVGFRVDRDIDIAILKAISTSRYTLISLQFRLEEEEIDKLNSKYVSGSRTDGFIQIEVNLHRTEDIEFRIKIKKEGNKISQITNIQETLKFINDNFHISYIPSIRTKEQSMTIINSLIRKELMHLEENNEYRESINKIDVMMSDVLSKIGESINEKLRFYIPSVRETKIDYIERSRPSYRDYRSYSILIDDGVETKLEDKGDGIISLVAISLLHSSELHRSSSLLMIDEPEAHLHSSAIRELRSTLNDLKDNAQVLISTHHQIFVDRNKIESNYLVNSGNVKQVKKISEIRKELGINHSENLLNAETILFVEGKTDKTIIERYLIKKSKKVKMMIENSQLVIIPLDGVKNLNAQVTLYNNILCDVICFLDNDEASKKVVEKMRGEKTLSADKILICKVGEKKESELEDLLDKQVYKEVIENMFDIDISSRYQMENDLKFSDRIKKIINSFSKDMNDSDLKEIKITIAKKVLEYENINSAFSEEGKLVLNNLIESLEKRIRKNE